MTPQDEPNPPPHDDAAQHRWDAMRDAEPPDSEPRAEVIARIDAALHGELTAEHRAMCELELVRLLAMDDARGGSVSESENTEPEWSDVEHDEIMRLHVVDGLTISEAKLLVFERRQDGGEPR